MKYERRLEQLKDRYNKAPSPGAVVGVCGINDFIRTFRQLCGILQCYERKQLALQCAIFIVCPPQALGYRPHSARFL